jgi:hypothetical protein
MEKSLYSKTLFIRHIGNSDFILFYDKNNDIFVLKGKAKDEDLCYKSSNLDIFSKFVTQTFLLHSSTYFLILIEYKEEILLQDFNSKSGSLCSSYLSNTDYDSICSLLSCCYRFTPFKKDGKFMLLKNIHIAEKSDILKDYLLMLKEIF